LLGGLQDNGTALRGTANTAWRSVLGGDGGYIASTDRTAFYDVVIATDDPQVFLLGTHRVYKTTNAGGSWTALSGDLTGGAPAAIRAMAVSPTNAQIVWVATNDHRVLVSTDGGANFTKKLDAPGWVRTTRELAVPPWDEKVAFVAVQRFGVDQVRMTKNLGDAWTGIDGDLPDVPANAIDAAVVAGQQMIFVGTDAGVYFTCNEGQHWAKLGTTLPNTVVSDVRYDPALKRVVVGTFGRGAWTIEEPTADGCTGPGGPDGGITTGVGGAGGAGGTGAGGAGIGGADTGAGGTGIGAGGNGTGGNAGVGGNIGTGGVAATTGTSTTSSGGPNGATGTAGDSSGCACSVAPGAGRTALSFTILGFASALWRRRRRG
jgi:MYXO-CTERM domain-containing protein